MLVVFILLLKCLIAYGTHFRININKSLLVYGTHNFLQGLLGYLILFVIQAFVPQRQLLHRGLFSLLSVPKVSKNFIFTLLVLTFTSFNKTLAITLILFFRDMLSRYPLNLIKMNNTSLPCITATAGTRFGQDT